MSGSTVGGGSTMPSNFSGSASGSASAYAMFFGPAASIGGGVLIGGSATISGPAVADTSAGGNSITAINPAVVFVAPNDTVSSAAAATVFGANAGQTTLALAGADSSVTGGSGDIAGTVSGANSTLVGGTGVSLFTVAGAGSLAVGGSAGVTGIDERNSTGPETVATNPLGNTGTLVAFLGSGADTVIGGSGASTIAGGSGPDVFAFVKGHAGGSEVILGFKPGDNIAFAGYGYGPGDAPTEAVGVVDGIASDVITLEDGTKITLVGIDHKIF